MTFLAADVNELALSIFGLVLAITLGVTYVASKRVSSATDFWAAGRGLTGPQNGFAIAGGTNPAFGQAVAGTGDFNGDGFADIAVGLPSGVGASYLIFGHEAQAGALVFAVVAERGPVQAQVLRGIGLDEAEVVGKASLQQRPQQGTYGGHMVSSGSIAAGSGASTP